MVSQRLSVTSKTVPLTSAGFQSTCDAKIEDPLRDGSCIYRFCLCSDRTHNASRESKPARNSPFSGCNFHQGKLGRAISRSISCRCRCHGCVLSVHSACDRPCDCYQHRLIRLEPDHWHSSHKPNAVAEQPTPRQQPNPSHPGHTNYYYYCSQPEPHNAGPLGHCQYTATAAGNSDRSYYRDFCS